MALAGTEAVFADLGHFNRHAIQVGMDLLPMSEKTPCTYAVEQACCR